MEDRFLQLLVFPVQFFAEYTHRKRNSEINTISFLFFFDIPLILQKSGINMILFYTLTKANEYRGATMGMKPMDKTKRRLDTTYDPEGDELSEQSNEDPYGDEISEQFDNNNAIGPEGDEIREKHSPLPTKPKP